MEISKSFREKILSQKKGSITTYSQIRLQVCDSTCMSHMSSNNRQVSLMNKVNIQDTRPNAIKLFKRGFSNCK